MSAPELVVRAATLDDLEFIVHANTRIAQETENITLDEGRLRTGVKAILGNPALGFYLIAELVGQRAGQMMITFEWSDWRNGMFWWIQSVYTAPESRRRGVFRALYQHAESLAKEQGEVCGLRLYVEEHNHRAQATYRGCGMQEAPYRVLEVDYVISRAD